MIKWVWIYWFLKIKLNIKSLSRWLLEVLPLNLFPLDEDFEQELTLANDKLVVVYFFTTW